MIETPPSNKDLHFKGQYAGETVVAFFRAHWIKLLASIAIHMSVAMLLIILFGIFSTEIMTFFKTTLGQIILVLSVFLMTYFAHKFFIKLVNHFLNTVIITNIRIVENQKTLFLRDFQISLDLKVVQDVKKEQHGFLENLLNFGELVFMMSSSDVRIIHYVPNPNFHFRLVNRIKLEILQKRTGKDLDRQHQPLFFENFSMVLDEEKNLET